MNVFYILIILALIEFIPIIAATIFGYNYGATKIGIIQQKLNAKYNLAYISWFAYNFLIILLIINTYKSKLDKKYKLIIIGLLLLISYLAIYPLLQIGNAIFTLTFKNKPFIDDYYNYYPNAIKLENNYKLIKNEFLQNYKDKPECLHENIQGFQISTGSKEKCWRTIILKKQGKFTDISKSYPLLSKLLSDNLVHNAVFSILDGNVNIPPHTGYYKGYLRYHLGIIIPKENDKSPFIVCGGQKYYWENGKGVLFDDMFLHYVENPTNSTRVVLYLDILRNDVPPCILPLYNFFNSYIENHYVIKKLVKVQHNTNKNN